MQKFIDICHKESEGHADYLEHSTSHFEILSKITVNVSSVIPQEKQNEG